MLNLDNNIKSVTLQSREAQGLDDVVVKYDNDKTKCIQIKHTRVDDTITFGDMISFSEKKQSLLKTLSVAWKEAHSNFGETEPVLYTNRKSGKREAPAKLTEDVCYIRPPLKEFWELITKQLQEGKSIDKVEVKKGWKEAWKLWLTELSELNDEEKYNFMRALKIESEQPELEQVEANLVDKIAKTFGVDENQAQPIKNALDSALRKWATTLRGEKEEVDRETVFETLSIQSQVTVGEHNLLPPYPFFSSRQKLLDELEVYLKNGEKRIIFLTGDPGKGKTSVVSALANKRNSAIDLRYHAFKTITPNSPILPADIGKTVTARALWSDLLSQIRILFKGRLSKYNVPIFSDFLTVEQLRSNVLRLAKINGEERGTPTVIAIDGIDHAARAGMNTETFLSTLVPPEEVPKEVRFLIVGQPSVAYENYPIWLRDLRADIAHWHIEGIKEEDIRLMISSKTNLAESELDLAARVVDSVAKGNTLSAIFAIHEAKECKSAEELQQILLRRELHNGISVYYETIWKSAVREINEIQPFLGKRLAVCLALASERLNGNDLSEIFKEHHFSPVIWGDFFRKLRPLVTEENGGFRVTHNDVRVHLMRQIKGEHVLLKEVASNMADYYWHAEGKGFVRHYNLFDLFEISGRSSDKAKVFTPQYVMEGIALERPINELQEQCKSALFNLSETVDWKNLQILDSAILTLKQFKRSIDWTGEELDFNKSIPPLLLTEGRVKNIETWDLDIISGVIRDAERLINERELVRARGLMERWFTGISPNNVVSILSEKYSNQEKHSGIDNETESILRGFGKVSQHTGLTFSVDIDQLDEIGENAIALFFGSYVKEAIKIGGIMRLFHSLKITKWMFWHDLETCLELLGKERKWREIALFLRRLGNDENTPISFKIKAGVYALLLGNQELYIKWTKEVEDLGFGILDAAKDKYDEDHPVLYIMVSFILGWTKKERVSGGISQEGTTHFFKERSSDRGMKHLRILLNVSASVSKWLSVLLKEVSPSTLEVISVKDVLQMLNLLVMQIPPNERVSYNLDYITKSLIELLIECCTKAGGVYNSACYEFIRDYCKDKYPINYMLSVGWSYLYRRNEFQLLNEWFDYRIGPSGNVWSLGVAERIRIVDDMTKIAVETGFTEKVQQAQARRKWGLISYVGHKEYVLEEFIPWFEELSGVTPISWKNEGKKLLELSQEASVVGDNRIEIYLMNAFITAVAKSGVEDMWCFYKAKNVTNNLLDNPHMLINGIISMLETVELTEKNALTFWGIGIGLLNWKKEIDRIYLEDLKEAILRAAEREGFSNIGEKLKGLGHAEYYSTGDRERYRLPNRWFSGQEDEQRNEEWEILKAKIQSEDIESVINHIYDKAGNTDSYELNSVWRSFILICSRLEEERPAEYLYYLNRLRDLLISKEIEWTTTGILEAYKAIIPLYEDSERWIIIKKMISNIQYNKDYWIESVHEMLDPLCFSRAKSIGVEAVQDGCIQKLETHFIWLNGNGNIPGLKCIDLPESVVDTPKTWQSFAMKYLMDVLQSNNSSRIELAIRGIWTIFQIEPTEFDLLGEDLENSEIRIKEWFLLIAERIARSNPESFSYISNFVKHCYDSDVLTLKMQAWVVYNTLKETSGIEIPNLNFKEHTNQDILKEMKSSGNRLMEIPSIQQGALHLLQGTRAASNIFDYLRAVTKEPLIDLEKKLNNYLNMTTDFQLNISEVKIDSGEMQYRERIEKRKVMDILYYELYCGKWNNLSTMRLAQALLTGDDPFILLDTPTPAIDKEAWVIDTVLDKYLEEGRSNLEQRLLGNVKAGIKEDEVVLGAVLLTYSSYSDVKFIYNQFLRNEEDYFLQEKQSGLFSGRSFAFNNLERYDPFDELEWADAQMTYGTGGMSNFMNQSFLISPSTLWNDLFNWSPSPENTRIWLHEGEEVARMEYMHGPFRELYGGRIDRQPILQRWVCKREAYEKVTKALDIISKSVSNLIVQNHK
ncbi:ATP-binding protein [Bacillus cereus]|nr:ATP-binding protein [Bacillus cereus]